MKLHKGIDRELIIETKNRRISVKTKGDLKREHLRKERINFILEYGILFIACFTLFKCVTYLLK